MKVGFASLGCPKNLVDSEIMIARLDARGFELVTDPAEAEVLVVNTCAFIDSAKEESINTILDMARYKDIGNCRRLVVAGCLAHRYKADLLKSIPEIDACIGLDELHRIEEACAGSLRVSRGNPHRSRRLYGVADARISTAAVHSRYLKISEGCNHKCSFCVIPTFRGLHRSRTPGDIVAEARVLADNGAVEINLVAQDLAAYGGDLGLDYGLPSLLEQLARVDGIEWIRLHYMYPQGLTPRLLEVMAREEKIVPYLDVPLQHGAKQVLRDMRRPGNRISSLRALERVREAVPEVAIRTSLIVGFPTEGDAEYEELLDFVRTARFDHLGVFTYSHEENSEAAARFEDVVPAAVKLERREGVMAIQQEISLTRHEKMVGTRRACLIEGLHPESDMLLVGRLATQAPEVDGSVIINDGTAQPGRIVTVEITEAHPYDLVARIV